MKLEQWVNNVLLQLGDFTLHPSDSAKTEWINHSVDFSFSFQTFSTCSDDIQRVKPLVISGSTSSVDGNNVIKQMAAWLLYSNWFKYCLQHLTPEIQIRWSHRSGHIVISMHMCMNRCHCCNACCKGENSNWSTILFVNQQKNRQTNHRLRFL